MTPESRETLKLQLMRHEGTGPVRRGRVFPYQDTVGKLSLGYGRNLSDRGISFDEAMFLLESDINDTLRDCLTFPWFDRLNPTRQRVVANLVFNMGLPTVRKFTRTLAAISRGDYEAAADYLLQSKYAKQVKGRAIELARQMRTGKDT